MIKAIQIDVEGKVQGVGFRPFVWKLAKQFNLKGKVWNHSKGVSIQLIDSSSLDDFVLALTEQCPPLARIDHLNVVEIQFDQLIDEFVIVESTSLEMITHIAPDAATCPACLAELQDIEDRRFAYPFLNCTHCGPRFSIIKAMPYDRPNTVMSAFPLCTACKTEYLDPADRRFHAQPIACGQCGPHLFDEAGVKSGSMIKAVSLINSDKVIAIKGLGGFHFACLATSDRAVARLRARKRRPNKPFALMMRDITMVKAYCRINDQEANQLISIAAPIVLLEKQHVDGDLALSAGVSPNSRYIGVMLPSTPLHHQLFTMIDRPLVMTSGNPSGLPPVLNNDMALTSLSSYVDGFVLHNREIVQRVDDSVVQIRHDGSIDMLRRARGYVPDALPLPDGFPTASGFLALGSDLKASFAMGYEKGAIVSQYLGDLSTLETQSEYDKTIAHFLALYQQTPNVVIEDAHPAYVNRLWGRDRTLERHTVFHHHAHVAACLGEHLWPMNGGKVLAWALDGIGCGPNGQWWGGELLIADYRHCERIGGLPATPLAGGDHSAKSPWRIFAAHLWRWYPEAFEDVSLASRFDALPLPLLKMGLTKKIGCPDVSSMGRFFDAVAASLGICFDGIDHEGQAAVQLMNMAETFEASLLDPLTYSVPFEMQWGGDNVIDLAHFWQHWMHLEGSIQEKAWVFHRILAKALSEMVNYQCDLMKMNTLVLTGGVCHNRLLMRWVDVFISSEVQCLRPNLLPSGDGGLAFGQLLIGLASQE